MTVAVTEVPEGAPDESGAGSAMPTVETSILLAAIREQGVTIRHQADCLTRALEATTAGYGRVRPAEPARVTVKRTLVATVRITSTV